MTDAEVEARLKLISTSLYDQMGALGLKHKLPASSAILLIKMNDQTRLMLRHANPAAKYGTAFCWPTHIYPLPQDCRQEIWANYGMALFTGSLIPSDDVSNKFPILIDDTLQYGKVKICAWDMINKKYLEI